MASYTDLTPCSVSQNLNHIHTNASSVGEYGVSSATGVWVTPLRQKQCYNTVFAIWSTTAPAAGSAMTGGLFGHVYVGSDGTITVIHRNATDVQSGTTTSGTAMTKKGGIAVSGASGAAIVDTASGNGSVTDNTLSVGWFTNTVDSQKYLAICNRLDDTTFAANTLFIKAV